MHNPKLLAFAPPAPPAKPMYRPRGLPWREKSGRTALPGYPEDESIDEAKRRRKWLLHNETGIALSMNIGKAIANKKGATRIDSAPDIWYAYQPAHGRSCADAEMVNGVWTCGIRRLQCGCVIYSISHKDHTFADEIEALTPCRVYRFGPVENSVWSGTLATSEDAKDIEALEMRGGGDDPHVKYALTTPKSRIITRRPHSPPLGNTAPLAVAPRRAPPVSTSRGPPSAASPASILALAVADQAPRAGSPLQSPCPPS